MLMPADWREIGVWSLYWLGYFALHSLLASLKLKHWVATRFPGLMRSFRLLYNLLAVVLLLPVLWWVLTSSGPLLWAWHGLAAWLANGLALGALFGFWLSLKYYDSQEFLGLRQWRSSERRVEDREAFHLSPIHRHVRHPWYFFSLVLIWTRDMNTAMLLSAVLMTLYFIVGSRLEERKLLVYHGDVYQRYQRRVPGLLPWPGKSLSAEEAATLLAEAPPSSLSTHV